MATDWTNKYQPGTLLRWTDLPQRFSYYLVLDAPVPHSDGMTAVVRLFDLANSRTIMTTCGKTDKMWIIVQACNDDTDG